MKSSTRPEIEVVYEEQLELLDESVHLNSVELVREINHLKRENHRLRKEINGLKK